MATTVTLNASAEYGYGGKQYIARITGRDPKFTFAREFVGQKSGKRKEYAELVTDEPGLYLTCDIDRKGNKEETFWIIYEEPMHGLYAYPVSKEDAMDLAKRIDSNWRIEVLRKRLATTDWEAKAEETTTIKRPVGLIKEGEQVTYRQLKHAIQVELGEAEESEVEQGWPTASPEANTAAIALLKQVGATDEEIQDSYRTVAFSIVECVESSLAGWRSSKQRAAQS